MISFGGFLNSNFWQTYRQHNSQSIEDLLSKPDCSVEKLLDDEDILQEFKTQNNKLLTYFDHDKMKKLIDFITIMPPEDADKKRGHKYPFLSLEIFNCEIGPLMEKFFEAPEPKEPEADTEKTNTDMDDDDVIQDKTSDGEGEKEEKKTPENSNEPSKDAEEEKKEENPSPQNEPEKEENAEEDVTNKTSPTLTRQDTPQPGSSDDLKEVLDSAKNESGTEDKKEKSETTQEEAAATTEEPKEENKVAAEPETEETKPVEELKKEEEVTASDNASNKQEGSEKPVAADAPKTEISSFENEPEKEEEQTNESTQLTTAADASEHSDEEVSKYMLLDRLFKFISIGGDQDKVNPVLAGYFSKVVQMLINRKQKQIVPYIFAEEKKVVECLLAHVYSRSIAEVLHRLLHTVESNFDDELAVKITKSKQVILNSLIDQLKNQEDDETVMNAAFILQDIMEQKSFFQMLTKKQNLQKMFEIAFGGHTDVAGQSSYTTQGLVARFVQQYNDRQKKKTDGEDRWDNSGDDDDIIVNELSDEEGEDSKAGNNAAILDIIVSMIRPIDRILEQEPGMPVQSQFNNKRILPLGNTKLRAVELLASIVSLKHPQIIAAVRETKVMQKILALIEKHPWNNMVQLKAHQIFEYVLSADTIENQERIDFLKAAELTSSLVRMAQTPEVKFNSGNIIRNGFMGFVTQLANLIIQNRNSKDMDTLEGASEVFTEEWTEYVAGELETSNERNRRNLGGRPTSTTEEDDETNQFDVNMDNIMKRFKSFTTVMQNNSSADDDDEKDEDEKDEDEDEYEAANEPEGESRPRAISEDKVIEVDLPKIEKIDSTFSDSGFWKISSDAAENELEDLLKDYE